MPVWRRAASTLTRARSRPASSPPSGPVSEDDPTLTTSRSAAAMAARVDTRSESIERSRSPARRSVLADRGNKSTLWGQLVPTICRNPSQVRVAVRRRYSHSMTSEPSRPMSALRASSSRAASRAATRSASLPSDRYTESTGP